MGVPIGVLVGVGVGDRVGVGVGVRVGTELGLGTGDDAVRVGEGNGEGDEVVTFVVDTILLEELAPEQPAEIMASKTNENPSVGDNEANLEPIATSFER